jgi:hypothetical protein
MPEPTMTPEGYPTDATLDAIRAWPIEKFADCEALLEFVGRAWWAPNYFHRRRESSCRWTVSTSGWSGNESLIEAMQANSMFWALSWVSSARGGHYEFETPDA